jgi:hypothetical protein
MCSLCDISWEAFDGETWFPVKDVRVKRELFGIDVGTFSVEVRFLDEESSASASPAPSNAPPDSFPVPEPPESSQ